MPIYKMKCPVCHKEHDDVWCKVDEKDKQECEDCGNILEVVPSLGSFQLKGRGWFNSGGY